MRLQDNYCKQKFEQGRKEIFRMYVCSYILWSILQCMYVHTILPFYWLYYENLQGGGAKWRLGGGADSSSLGLVQSGWLPQFRVFNQHGARTKSLQTKNTRGHGGLLRGQHGAGGGSWQCNTAPPCLRPPSPVQFHLRFSSFILLRSPSKCSVTSLSPLCSPYCPPQLFYFTFFFLFFFY